LACSRKKLQLGPKSSSNPVKELLFLRFPSYFLVLGYMPEARRLVLPDQPKVSWYKKAA